MMKSRLPGCDQVQSINRKPSSRPAAVSHSAGMQVLLANLIVGTMVLSGCANQRRATLPANYEVTNRPTFAARSSVQNPPQVTSRARRSSSEPAAMLAQQRDGHSVLETDAPSVLASALEMVDETWEDEPLHVAHVDFAITAHDAKKQNAAKPSETQQYAGGEQSQPIVIASSDQSELDREPTTEREIHESVKRRLVGKIVPDLTSQSIAAAQPESRDPMPSLEPSVKPGLVGQDRVANVIGLLSATPGKAIETEKVADSVAPSTPQPIGSVIQVQATEDDVEIKAPPEPLAHQAEKQDVAANKEKRIPAQDPEPIGLAEIDPVTVDAMSQIDKAGNDLFEASVGSMIASEPLMPMTTLPMEPIIDSYVIEVGDQVELKFLKRPDLNETLIVGEDGVIWPAITGPVLAVGKTASMVKQELAERLMARRYDAMANTYGNKAVEYFIAVDDMIEVRFSTLTDLSDTVKVRPDGKISLARIGEVIAEGKTPAELQSELEKLYEDEVKQPELVIIMREMTSPDLYVDGVAVATPIKGIGEFTIAVTKAAPRLVYVMGEVGLPSAIPYQPKLTALRAISSTGGAKRTANLKHVMILRSQGTGGCVREISVDLRPCRECVTGMNSCEDGGFADIPLQPNDVIMIPKTRIAKVQDWLDQYVYDLFPPLRNSSAFTVLYNNGIPGVVAGP